MGLQGGAFLGGYVVRLWLLGPWPVRDVGLGVFAPGHVGDDGQESVVEHLAAGHGVGPAVNGCCGVGAHVEQQLLDEVHGFPHRNGSADVID